jgi:hypothetical protein
VRRRDRNPAERLRFAVQALPRVTREAMLRGTANPIVVGAYVDPDSGGICPMLAAHRNGGRTNLGSFARAWDRYTGAKRPRLATRREVRTLQSLLESSLADDLSEGGSIAQAAAQIRAERAELAARQAHCAEPEAPAIAEPEPPAGADIRIRRRQHTGERDRTGELRDRLRWSWMRPARRCEEFQDLLAAAEEQLTDEEAAPSGEEQLRRESRLARPSPTLTQSRQAARPAA